MRLFSRVAYWRFDPDILLLFSHDNYDTLRQNAYISDEIILWTRFEEVNWYYCGTVLPLLTICASYHKCLVGSESDDRMCVLLQYFMKTNRPINGTNSTVTMSSPVGHANGRGVNTNTPCKQELRRAKKRIYTNTLDPFSLLHSGSSRDRRVLSLCSWKCLGARGTNTALPESCSVVTRDVSIILSHHIQPHMSQVQVYVYLEIWSCRTPGGWTGTPISQQGGGPGFVSGQSRHVVVFSTSAAKSARARASETR